MAADIQHADQLNASYDLTADRPISSRREDQLGRSSFASELATAICQWRERDSLVIALYGQWGIGKSSIKNLVLEDIRNRKPAIVDVLEFNPWQWHGHADVSTAFFREVLNRLGKGNPSEQTRKVIKTLRQYAAYLGLASAILGGGRGLMALVLTVLGLLTVASSFLPAHEHTLTFVRIVGFTALLIAGILQWGQAILEKFATWRELRTTRPSSLEDHKKHVIDALQQHDKTLLVVIDDVDRLSASEIQGVFQLIKANADFPRFVYLVLFQRDNVERALADLVKEKGSAFLEKIVQVGFDVPRPRQDEIDQILFQGLDKQLGEDAKKVNETYWGNVYYGSLRVYFQDLRDVKRFLASLGFHLNLLRTKGTLNVNPVDLIAVETLRVFQPELYGRFRAAKGLLTGRVSSEGNEQTAVAEQIKLLIADAAPEHKSSLESFIEYLFPSAAFAFGGVSYGSDSRGEWTRDLKVSSETMFDRYFEFALSKGDISQYEVDMLLALTSDAKALTRELKRLSSEGRLTAALDRLDISKQRIPLDHAVATLTAIFDAAELLPERKPGAMFNPHWTVQRIAHQVLKRETDPDRREAMLENVLKNTSELSMAVFRISSDTNSQERAKNPDAMLVRESAVPKFQAIGREKIESAAANGTLMNQRDLAHILYRWRDWASEADVRKWVANLAASPEGALAFLRAFLHKGLTQTYGDHVGRVRPFIKYSEIEQFADLEGLDAQVAKLRETKLSEPDRRLIDAFRKAMERKRAGTTEGDFGWEEDEDSP